MVQAYLLHTWHHLVASDLSKWVQITYNDNFSLISLIVVFVY